MMIGEGITASPIFYAKIYKKVVFMKKYDCFAYRFVGEVRA